jgi:hypothetical protein
LLPAPLNALPYLTGVGSKGFVESVKTLLGALARGRKVREAAEAYQLREPSALYSGHFGVKNEGIGPAPIIGTFMMNNQ